MKSTIQDTLLNGASGYDQAQVYLSFSGRRNLATESSRLPALMIGDFTISTGAAWNTPLASSSLENLSQIANTLKSTAQGAANFFGMELDVGSQVQLKSLEQTTNFWTGSERPVFNIELLYISLVRGQDVREQVLKLYKTVMPTRGELFGKQVLLNAPLGYNPFKQGTGTFAIQLGKWFRATGLVMKSVQFTYSQEMVPLDGGKGVDPTKFAPLYAKGSISFEPYRDITYGDFRNYFIGVNNV